MKLIISIATGIFYCISGLSQNVGIGTATPLSKLHVFGGTSGATPFAFSPLVVENNGHTYINLLSPAANETAILFGQPGSAANGVIMYNNSGTPNGFQFRNNNNLTRMVITNNGNVGIGTITPFARLHIADSSVLFSAAGDIPGVTGLLPAAGPGRRMMWYPLKAAFRAGYVNADQWDQNNIGPYSVATGFGSIANGYYTTALGLFSKASGNASIALGNQTTAKAYGGVSVGSLNDFSDNPDPGNINATDRIFQVGNGFGFFPGNAMTILRNGNVGIGITTPNSPLSFPSSLGKKINLYPGATGDAGLGVSGNRLEIYSDNPSADVAIGYDAAGTFNERFAIKPNGALAVNGNTGNAGQVLQSNGTGAASWSNIAASPYAFTIKPIYYNSLNGVALSEPLVGIDNSTFTLNQNATFLFTLTLEVYANSPGSNDSKGYVVVEILNAASTRVSFASSAYYIRKSTTDTKIVSGVAINLPAATYTIKARLVRLTITDGDATAHASLAANEQGVQFIGQVLPN